MQGVRPYCIGLPYEPTSPETGCDRVPDRESYGIVLQRIIRDPSLSAEAKAIYAYLCTFVGTDGTCYPSISLMCKELNISESRYYRHIKKLISTGAVTVRKRRNGSRFAQNLYEVARPVISPHPQNEGTEVRPSVSPSHGNTGTENEGVNNTSCTNTRGLNNTSTYLSGSGIGVQLCSLINEGKRKAGSKGRVKIGGADRCVADLIQAGLQLSDILAAAQEAAKTGMDLDWYSFPRYCKNR